MGSAFVRRARHALHDQRSRSLALGATVGIYFSRVGFVSSWIFKFQPARRWAQQRQCVSLAGSNLEPFRTRPGDPGAQE